MWPTTPRGLPQRPPPPWAVWKCPLHPCGPSPPQTSRSHCTARMVHDGGSRPRSRSSLCWPWCGPFWRRPDASADPPKPPLSRHRARRLPSRHRWARRCMPPLERYASLGRSAGEINGQVLGEHPLSGAVFGFRHRAATAMKLLCSAGQGFWLGSKRLAQGRCHWWPHHEGASSRLAARE